MCHGKNRGQVKVNNMLMDVTVLVRQDGDKYFKSNISVILLMCEIIDIETLTLVTQWYPSGAQNIVM